MWHEKSQGRGKKGWSNVPQKPKNFLVILAEKRCYIFFLLTYVSQVIDDFTRSWPAFGYLKKYDGIQVYLK